MSLKTGEKKKKEEKEKSCEVFRLEDRDVPHT